MGFVMEYNWKGYFEKFVCIVKVFGIDISNMIIEEVVKVFVNWMYDLVEDLEVLILEEQGVLFDMIECLLKEVMKDL